MSDALNKVDWDLLRTQSEILSGLLTSGRVISAEREALEGVLNLIDSLRDEVDECSPEVPVVPRLSAGKDFVVTYALYGQLTVRAQGPSFESISAAFEDTDRVSDQDLLTHIQKSGGSIDGDSVMLTGCYDEEGQNYWENSNGKIKYYTGRKPR